jgi:hypothetical protein
MYRMANCSASFTSSARCKDIETIKLIEKICLSNQTRSYRQSTFILLARWVHQLARVAGCHTDLLKGELPHGETVASAVYRQCMDDVLTVICCSLNKRYLSIHTGSSSMDNEPAAEVCEQRRGHSGKWVDDDMAAVTVLKGGNSDEA